MTSPSKCPAAFVPVLHAPGPALGLPGAEPPDPADNVEDRAGADSEDECRQQRRVREAPDPCGQDCGDARERAHALPVAEPRPLPLQGGEDPGAFARVVDHEPVHQEGAEGNADPREVRSA